MRKPRPPVKQHGQSTAHGPAINALQRYCLLIGLDPAGCARLFAPDAELRCTKQGAPVKINGRDAIQQHLAGIAAQGFEYSMSFFRQDGSSAMAEIAVSRPDWGKLVETVLVRMDGTLIAEFEIISWEAPPASTPEPSMD